MQMDEDVRKRVLEELQRIHREIQNCANCEALRGQYGRLSILLPPEPMEHDGKRYTFDPPQEYWDIVNQQLQNLLPSGRWTSTKNKDGESQ